MVTKRTIAILVSAVMMSAAQAYAQQCLHGADETAAEAARRTEALGVTRLVNNIQANGSSAKNGLYFHHFELATAPYVQQNRGTPLIKRVALDPNEEILPGWKLTLDVTSESYWFMSRT